MMNNRKHVQHDITSESLVPSHSIVLSTATMNSAGDGIEGDMEAIGLVQGINMGEGRPVSTQGEMGSKYLITLIGEGQQSMSFQRLVPLDTDGSNKKFKSALPLLYGLEDVSISYDFDEREEYSRPIQLVLEIYEGGDVVYKTWLKNASVGSTGMSFVAGSNFTGEPVSLAWEEAVDLKVNSTTLGTE